MNALRGRCWRILTALLSLGLVFSGLARADVVLMSDGRRIEGKILKQDDRKVKIDALIGQIRVILSLDRSDVESIEEKAPPARFRETPPASKRSRRAKVEYLEVPVIGELGEHVFATAVRRILAHAKSKRVGHVVFYLDSAGGDLDEAAMIYQALKKYSNSLTYHAIIRKCLGDAIAIPVWCKTVHVMPGATLGGLDRKLSEISTSERFQAEDEEVIRSQMAHEVVADTGRHPPASDVVRALLDPTVTLAAWRDDEENLRVDALVPSGLPKDRLIVHSDEKSVLQLSYAQMVALGMQSFEGTAKDLGKALGIKHWELGSDYGQRTMQKIAAERQKKARSKQRAYESKVKKNLARREKTERYIQHNMQQAAKWDPTKAEYATYAHRWGWGYGSWVTTDSVELTKESKKKWRNRTDACMHYLNRAAKGLGSMKRYDKEAEKLGLEPSYEAGEIDKMIADIKVRFVNLGEHRNKKTK